MESNQSEQVREKKNTMQNESRGRELGDSTSIITFALQEFQKEKRKKGKQKMYFKK